MTKYKFLALILILLIISHKLILSQEVNKNIIVNYNEPIGTEFWLCFMTNYKEDPNNAKNALLLELFITGDKDANVNVEISAINFKKQIFVKGGTVESVVIDPLAQIRSNEVVEKGLGVRVTSDEPISVYGLNRRYQTTDTYLGLPVNVLGKEYRVMCYHIAESLSPIFAIVGVEDNTLVEIIPNTLTSSGKKPKEPFQVTLNKGDVYQVKGETQRLLLRRFGLEEKDADLTGTLIKANKKIAVFSGHECTYVPVGPPRIKACNHLVEQMPPISSWGKHFYVGRLKGRSKYTYRVLANSDNTKVFENSKLIATLKAGEYYEKNSNETVQLTADKPVLVAQYSQGFENGDKIGDPMMLLISPTQQFLKQYRFATPVNGSWNHIVNVVVPNTAIGTIELNGKKVPASKFESLGITRYSIAYLEVPFGTHFIKGDEPFGLYSYGFGYGEVDAYDAYGNMGGQSFLDYIPKTDTLAPIADILNIDGKDYVVFRDDRPDDTGLKSIKIIDSSGIKTIIPLVMAGVPQLPIYIEPEIYNSEGRMIFEVSDVSDNAIIYTLCYYYNLVDQSFIFEISEGINNKCLPSTSYSIGIFGKYSLVSHKSNFSRTGNVILNGNTSDASGSGGLFGFYLGRKIIKNINLNVKLSFDNYGGIIEAPDSLISSLRDPVTGKLVPYQEMYQIELNSYYTNLSLGIDYSFIRNMYANFSLNIAYKLNNSVDINQKIIIPDNYVYQNGSNSRKININELTELKSLRFGLSLGIGANFPINRYINPFVEVNYNYYPFDIIDKNWKINTLSFLIGLRYKI